MDGLDWIIKAICKQAGITIDPDEVKRVVETAKVLIPTIATRFDEMNERIKRVELKLDQVLGDPLLTSLRAAELTEKTEASHA
jgi:hypothetical protein